jgi:DNA-directed RNA polymerase subunit K/omega
MSDFSTEKRQWGDIFNMLKEKKQKENKNRQPRVLYLAKLSLQSKEEIKTLLDKPELEEFVSTRSALQEILQGVLQVEMKEHKAVI